MRLFRCSILSAALPLLLATVAVYAEPWDLREYELCRRVTLKGIKAEASGVTYSDVTNTVWVVTRRPPVLAEYTLEGRLVRTINTKNAKLADPEGITWMYDYKFAISQEGRRPSDSSISIVEAAPWRDEVRPLKRIELDNIRHDKNKGLEGLTWDSNEEIFITSQEQDPVQIWGVDPRSGRAKKIYRRAKQSRDYKDFASVYKPRDDDGLYILSEPNKKVYSVDEDGEKVRRQEKRVEGRMPEGLTFTSGGELMVIVGEPDEMFVYSSTGNCKYDRRRRQQSRGTRSASNKERDSEEDGSEEDDSEEDDSEDETPARPPRPANPVTPVTKNQPLILSDGYCSYDQCRNSDSQGTAWCRASADHCVGACGGWWCLGKQGPAITKMNLLYPASPTPSQSQPRSPPPSPQPLPPTPPWYEINSDGFCSSNSDCRSLIEGPWCRQSAENCLSCGKENAWCPLRRGAKTPITRLNYPQALPGVPWYQLPSLGYCAIDADCTVGHSTPWCLASSSNCIGCSGAWCPRKGLNINEEPVTRDTFPEDLPEKAPPATLTQSAPGSPPGSAPVEAAAESPLFDWNEDDNGDEMVTADGYKAIVDMIFSGIVTLNENEELLLKKYVAEQAFGDEAAEPQVNIGSASVLQGRRLMGSNSIVEISFEILAETELHAEYITGKLVEAAKSGNLEDQLATKGLHVVLVANSTVVGAGIKAKDFPKAPPMPLDAIEAQVPVVSAFEVPDDEPLKIRDDDCHGSDFPIYTLLAISLGGLCLAVLLFAVYKITMPRLQPPCKSTHLDSSKVHASSITKSAARDHEQGNSVQQMEELSLAVHLDGIPSRPISACAEECSELEAEVAEGSEVSPATLSTASNSV